MHMRKSAAVALLAATVPFAATAGDLSGIPVAEQMNWTPTSCIRPEPPTVSYQDAGSLNVSVGDYNRYADAVQAYMGCVNEESLADQTTAQKVIAAEARRINDEVYAEAQRVRTGLTSRPATVPGVTQP